jgi:hypothetical protein
VYILLILFFSTFEIYAQNRLPCVTSRSEMDFSCKCKKNNSCLEAISKSEKNSLAVLSQQVGNDDFVMKSKKISMPAFRQMKAAFLGELDIKKFPFNEMKLMEEKLDSINKKLIPQAEAKLQEKGIKPHKINDRIDRYNQRIKNILGENAYNALTNNKISISPESLFEGKGKAIQVNVAQENDFLQNLKKEANISDSIKDKDAVTINNEASLDISPDSIKLANEQAEQAIQEKSYKIDSIHNDSSKNIFSLLSSRYIQSYHLLDQKTINRSLYGLDNEVIQAEIKSVISNMGL